MFFKMCLLRFCTGGAYAENHRSSVRRLTSVVKFLTSRVAVSGPTPTIWPNSRSSVILLCQIFDGFTACGKGSGVEAVGRPPSGPGWVHEIKHDGYRLIVRRDGEAVRLFTRRGYEWTVRYPAIARAALKLRAKSFTIDGEAAVWGPDGIAIFDALHRRGTVAEAMLFAFDLLELTVSTIG
jgi:hypothetical protein